MACSHQSSLISIKVSIQHLKNDDQLIAVCECTMWVLLIEKEANTCTEQQEEAEKRSVRGEQRAAAGNLSWQSFPDAEMLRAKKAIFSPKSHRNVV